MFGCIRNTWNSAARAKFARCGVHRPPFRQDRARVARHKHRPHRREGAALELTRALSARTALPRTHYEVRGEGLVDGDASVPGRGDLDRLGHVYRELATGNGSTRVRMGRREPHCLPSSLRRRSAPTVWVRSRRHLFGFVAERRAGEGGRGSAAREQPSPGRRTSRRLAGRDASLRASFRLDEAAPARRVDAAVPPPFIGSGGWS